MRVALLQCDEVLEKFRPQFGSYGQMIRRMFSCVDDSIQFDGYDCRAKQYPDDLDAYDFFITTGSRASVYDPEDWIRTLVEFIRRLAREKKKFFGICFGHQLMAIALEGRVEKSPKGWGIGVAANRIVSRPSWIDEEKADLNIIASHQDQIIALPEGATVIAESDFCPFFMVQWNGYFISIQGHPEWHRDYAKTLMHERRAIIGPTVIEAGLQSLAKKPDNDYVARWIINFVKEKL